MTWKRIDGMPESPQCCVACGGNPSDFEGHMQQALWAEGVDIDWGNMLYLCWECVQIIADLAGRATKEGFDKLDVQLNELQQRYEELEAEHAAQEELLQRVRDGAAARKQIKETAVR